MTRNSRVLSKGKVCVLSIVKNRPICITLSLKAGPTVLLCGKLCFGLLLQSILKCLAGPENRNGRSRDIDRGTGNGIVPCVGRFFTRFKCTKACEPDRAPFMAGAVIAASSEEMTAAVSFLEIPALAEIVSTISFLAIFRDLLSRIAFLLNRSCRISKNIIPYICDFFYCFCFNSTFGRKHGFLKKR